MGNMFYRNRFWFYRSLYDDYALREIRMSYIFAGLIYIPFYLWGVYINREVEVNTSHTVYKIKYLPRRNRIAEALFYEEFEMHLERYQLLKDTANTIYENEKNTMDHQINDDNDNAFSNDEDDDEDYDDDEDDEDDE